MSAAAHDPGAASGVLAPPSCGVPSGTPRRASLRFSLSLPGSYASLAMITRTDSSRSVRAEGDRQLPRHAEERGTPLDRLRDETQVREAHDQARDRDLALELGEMCAQAEVRPAPEGEVVVRPPLDVEAVRLGE